MSKLIDLKGQRFGFWLVQNRLTNKNGLVKWSCLCDCGNEREITTNSLRSGNSTSCGCNHSPDLAGLIFGELKVLEVDLTRSKHSKRYWLCKCNCGNNVTVNTNKLRNGKVTSCGCKTIDKTKNITDISELLKAKTAKNILRSMELIKEQTCLIASFNKELEKSVQLIADLRLQLKKPATPFGTF